MMKKMTKKMLEKLEALTIPQLEWERSKAQRKCDIEKMVALDGYIRERKEKEAAN